MGAFEDSRWFNINLDRFKNKVKDFNGFISNVKDKYGECLIITFIFFAIGLIVAVCFALLMKAAPPPSPGPPRTPIFAVESISASPINVSSSQITGDWNITFTIRNRYNLTSLFFDSINTSIYYKNVLLASENVDPFRLPNLAGREVAANMSAREVKVEKWAADDIVADRDLKGVLRVNVKVEARVWFSFRHKLVSLGFVSVDCMDLNVNANNGGLIHDDEDGGLRICSVELKESPLELFLYFVFYCYGRRAEDVDKTMCHLIIDGFDAKLTRGKLFRPILMR
ncbi:hypothetical protein LguiA_021520 [Lonicera macranthoides]